MTLWFGQESRMKTKKNVRSKFNFKFSNLLHMSKGRICIGNYMDIVSIVLRYNGVYFHNSPFIIIAIVSPEKFCTRGSVSVASSVGAVRKTDRLPMLLFTLVTPQQHLSNRFVDLRSFHCTACDFRFLLSDF